MKKVSLLLAFSFMISTCINAQERDSKWSLTAGPVLAFPIKYLHLFHSFGVGADFAAIHPISGGVSAGARANYGYFFGKKVENTGSAAPSSHYDAAHLLNILGDVNYQFENKLAVGVDLGLGLTLIGGHSDASFARIAYLSYPVGSKNPTLLAVFFEQTTLRKHFGLRASFRI